MRGKKQILESIGAVARRLGRAPTRAEFQAQGGTSPYFVLHWFRTWSDAVRAAGLRPYAVNAKVGDKALLEDWGKAVRRNRGKLPRHIYLVEGKYSPGTLAKRFGGWVAVAKAFRKFAKGKREWRDVAGLLAVGRRKKRAAARKNSRTAAPTKKAEQARLSDRIIYGNPMDFRGVRHEPVNEQGVVFLFGMLAKELGYSVEAMQRGFPDCEAKRQIAPGRWQRVRIEFEFESRNFREHGHPESGCDVIVCWRHNWEECPKSIEVVELRSVMETLAKAQG